MSRFIAFHQQRQWWNTVGIISGVPGTVYSIVGVPGTVYSIDTFNDLYSSRNSFIYCPRNSNRIVLYTVPGIAKFDPALAAAAHKAVQEVLPAVDPSQEP